MTHSKAAWRTRLQLVFAAAILGFAVLQPLVSTHRQAEAAQILERYVHIVDDSSSAAETDYDVSFQLPNGATLGTVRIEFCDEDPIPGEPCNVTTTESDEVPDLDADAGSAITITNWALSDTAGSATDNSANCTTANAALSTTHTAGTNLNYLDIQCGTGNAETIAAGGGSDTDYVNFRINNINNPSNTTSGNDNDTFYVRIYTYTSPDSPPAYAAGGNTLGEYEGGVAMSTAQQINVTARVQEELTFQVGADEVADNCADFTQTTVDLGVLRSGQVNFASTEPDTGTNSDTACVEVTTNAASGVNVYYIGDNLNKGACVGSTDTENGTPDETDDCINSDLDGSDADLNTNSGSADIAAGTEQWGLSVIDDEIDNNLSAATDTTSFGTTASGPYDGTVVNNGQADLTDNWTFVPNATQLICSSTTVVNTELCQIDMAGTAAITTPTGVYTTTLTFIANASF